MFSNRIIKLAFACILICSPLWAQQTTGGLRGEIKDSEGQPLPGANVTISSEALIGQTRTATTNELGVFRFPSIPIGTYKVEAAMDSFDTVVAQNIKVSLGTIAYIPLTMKLSGVAEALTVVGDSPVFDVNQSGLSTSYKKEVLEEVPTQRGMWDLMQQSPGVTVDVGDSQSARVIAFGSNRQSNSWNVDGVDVTAPETGDAWWYINPDVVEEIQVLGVGAPAEYGNHTGAVLNVVTKKGSNSFHGSANYFLQTEGLTGVNVRLPDSPYVFNRDKYYDVTGQVGGPLLKDRVWFFGGVEFQRDASTTPGVNPDFAPLLKTDKYDAKVTTRIGQSNELTGFFHYEDYDYPDVTSAFVASSAAGNEFGNNPAWGATFTSTLNENFLLEANYAGWWSEDKWGSQTGSLDDPFVDFDQSTPLYSGGLDFPYDYVTYRHQISGKATYYADQFLDSQHEFRFGVQYSYGSADTISGYGANGVYNYQYYGYQYQIRQIPVHYGGITNDLGFFIDDTVTVNDRLTLNLGVRFDHNTGSIPEFERLRNGTPSITPVANWQGTGEMIPGIDDFIKWNNVSPRLGFVWQPRGDGRSVVQGSFGVYYDHNVIGNWDVPGPGYPPIEHYFLNPETGQYELVGEDFSDIGFNGDIKPPRTLQYAAGYEQQLTSDSSIGVQYVYKDTKNLVGWEILGGTYEQVPFVDPFTGRQYTLLNIIEDPLLQKGNDPGNFPGSEGLDYFQKYHGFILSFTKRFADKWSLDASYTWSKSTGLIPRMLAQEQFAPFYGSREGSDPNNFFNAVGRLQGDRPNMFRAQVVFFKLPWDITASAAVDISSGRAHSRQIRVFGFSQGQVEVLMEPIGAFRYSPVHNIDLSIGKKINLGNDIRLRVDGQILNLLNSDQELSFAELALQNPTDTFVPDTWVKPRRLQIRLGFEF